MKRNLKAEIDLIIKSYLPEIQSNFDGKLNSKAQELMTECVNKCLNLHRHINDCRDLTSETFYYNDKNIDVRKEASITEYVSTKIYLQLVPVSKKEKSCFLGISKNDDDSLYNFKRKECSKFVRYVDDFREDGEGLEPLTINPDELYAVCTRKTVNFENLFEYYNKTDDNLLNVTRILFTDLFYRVNKENQQFLIQWTKQQLHSRAKSNIQHKKIDDFISDKITYSKCSRATQLILHKICNN